jgi:hypothetical protein
MPTNPTDPPDFDALVLGSQMAQSKAGEHELWKAALALENWYLLGLGEGDDVEPIFAQHDGKTHLLAFTDADRAEAAADDREKNAQTRPVILHLPPEEALEYLEALDADGQVAGVHFNNGPFAFGASLASVIDMHRRYNG